MNTIMKLRQFCINNNYFTAGSNEQYDKMFWLAQNGGSRHEIALIIWVCSSNVENVQQVVKGLEEIGIG